MHTAMGPASVSRVSALARRHRGGSKAGSGASFRATGTGSRAWWAGGLVERVPTWNCPRGPLRGLFLTDPAVPMGRCLLCGRVWWGARQGARLTTGSSGRSRCGVPCDSQCWRRSSASR
jgi:hypothetical protein